MKKSAAKYKLCKCRCRYKIKNLMREKTGSSIFFILFGPPALLTPFFSLGLLFFCSYPALTSVWSFFPTLLGLYLYFPEIAGCLKVFLVSEIASDTYPVAFAIKLQFHCQILAIGITKGFL